MIDPSELIMQPYINQRQFNFLELDSDKVSEPAQFQNQLKPATYFVNYTPEDRQLGMIVNLVDIDIVEHERRVTQKATQDLLEYENALNVS